MLVLRIEKYVQHNQSVVVDEKWYKNCFELLEWLLCTLAELKRIGQKLENYTKEKEEKSRKEREIEKEIKPKDYAEYL